LLKKILDIFQIFNFHQKLKLFFISLIILITAFIDIFTLYSLYLTIKLTTGIDNNNENNFLIKAIKFYFNPSDRSDLILTMFIFLIVIFFLKLMLVAYMHFLQFKFSNNFIIFCTNKIFRTYICNDYTFHLNSDIAKLIRNIQNEVSCFCTGVLQQFTLCFAEICLLVLVVSLLIFVDTNIFLISFFVIVFSGLIFFSLTKKIFKKYGIIRQNVSGSQLKLIVESFRGIVDIKIFNAESYIFAKMNQNVKTLANSNVITTFIQQLPRISFEFIAITMVSLYFILTLNLTTQISSEQLSSVALFAVALFKIIPSVSKILNCTQLIRYNYPAAKLICQELENAKINNPNSSSLLNEKSKINKKITISDSIELRNINYSYLLDEKTIFENLNLKIKKNECIGIFGESGSGKSTLINLIAGLIKPHKGEILIDGNNNFDQKLFMNSIGYVPQKVFIANDSLKSNIAFGQPESDIDEKRLATSSKFANIEEFIQFKKEKYDFQVGDGGSKLSGGQIQRLGIARALYRDPELLIFDESTSSLDSFAEEKFLNLISYFINKKTIIIVSHKINTLKNCHKIYQLKNKNLF
jgi:ABC-type multidrug transport system fused ATPase/permease subunit